MCLLIALTTDNRICDRVANGAAPSEQQAKRISINLYVQTGMKLLKAYSQLVLVVFVEEKRGISRFFFQSLSAQKSP